LEARAVRATGAEEAEKAAWAAGVADRGMVGGGVLAGRKARWTMRTVGAAGVVGAADRGGEGAT
jgi:hypothetical protein